MGDKLVGRLLAAAGYTITEAMTVVGAMGIVSAIAAPNIIRFKSAMEVQGATSQVGGVLQQTRSRAVAEAIPFLFLVQHEEVGDGERGAFALIVRDNDRSYSLTTPDDVETFKLDADVPHEIRQFGENPDVAVPDIPRAYTDATILERESSSGRDSSGSGSSGSGGSGSSGSGSGSSGSGSGGLLGGVGELLGGLLGGGSSGQGVSGSETASSRSIGEVSPGQETKLSDVVENGSTFPVSESEGTPGIAFNERGIPVALDSPSDWGSGAGAIYMSDDAGSVYAAVMSPLGEVSISRYDSGSGNWK
jgi:type II secretory pathway pseudopilin PulG